MTDRPIIFSPPMVRALLDGRKTMTRRLAWTADKLGTDERVSRKFQKRPTLWQKVTPGDRLWVRENFALVGGGDPGVLLREADWQETARLMRMDNADKEPRWTPSIHMPRWASRLTLTVTDVKIERLQDISEADAIAEGLSGLTKDGRLVKYGIPDCDGLPGNDDFGWHWEDWNADPRQAFKKLWSNIHGPDAWAANPFVVAITFNVHHGNIDKMEAAS